MATIKDMLAGLEIFAKHDPDGECNADHDQFYACGIRGPKIGVADVKILADARWWWDTEFECWSKFL